MNYKSNYKSPVGELLLTADEQGLTGVWFVKENKALAGGKAVKESKPLDAGVFDGAEEKETKAIKEAKRWLDVYFQGDEPDFMPELHLQGTEFQMLAWEKLLEIPYGVTTTYGELAKELGRGAGELIQGNAVELIQGSAGELSNRSSGEAERSGKMVSPQAVGGAVGHNPISIIVPCHRVIGGDGDLTGYGGGLKRKKALLELEGAYDEI